MKVKNFLKVIIDKFFEKINIKYIFDEKSSIIDLLKLNLKQIRLQDNLNSLDNNEKELIKNFVEKEYENFVKENFDKINELCCLIKAKNEEININSESEINKRLVTINISNDNIENNIKEQILQGCSESEKKNIELKQHKYLSDNKIKNEVKNILKYFVVIMFNQFFNKEIRNSLLNEKIF